MKYYFGMHNFLLWRRGGKQVGSLSAVLPLGPAPAPGVLLGLLTPPGTPAPPDLGSPDLVPSTSLLS